MTREHLRLPKEVVEDVLQIAYNTYGGAPEIYKYPPPLWLLARLRLPKLKFPEILNPNNKKALNYLLNSWVQDLSQLLPPSPSSPLKLLLKWSYLPEMEMNTANFEGLLTNAFINFPEPNIEEVYQFFRLRMLLFAIVYSLRVKITDPLKFIGLMEKLFQHLTTQGFYTNRKIFDPYINSLSRERKLGAVSEALVYAATLATSSPKSKVSPSTPLQDKAGIDIWIGNLPISVKTDSPLLPPLIQSQDLNISIPNCPPFNSELILQGFEIKLSPLNPSHLSEVYNLISRALNDF